jgi:solute carrier family 25 S-adenosylmethionine transporter 26
MACMVRVPTEVVKQRMQTGMYSSFSETIRQTYKEGGSKVGSFYKGFGITIMREIPFSLIQFPMYEFMKVSQYIHVIKYDA